ncbi:hypothetical protein FQN57_002799 [Myotisia sp. PD_48]|nr:hypothetical protein FQN57_002799 [Myotisia sp. PD_48]
MLKSFFGSGATSRSRPSDGSSKSKKHRRDDETGSTVSSSSHRKHSSRKSARSDDRASDKKSTYSSSTHTPSRGLEHGDDYAWDTKSATPTTYTISRGPEHSDDRAWDRKSARSSTYSISRGQDLDDDVSRATTAQRVNPIENTQARNGEQPDDHYRELRRRHRERAPPGFDTSGDPRNGEPAYTRDETSNGAGRHRAAEQKKEHISPFGVSPAAAEYIASRAPPPVAPQMPPPSKSFGEAAKYYGDQGQSVESQPGFGPEDTSSAPPGVNLVNQPGAIGGPGLTSAFNSPFSSSATPQNSTQFNAPLPRPSTSNYGSSSSIPGQPTPIPGVPINNAQPLNHHYSNTGLAAAGTVAGAAAAMGIAHSAHHNSHNSHSHLPNHSFQPHSKPKPNNGPLSKFIDFWKDPEGVAKFEEYTEAIGVCKHCFEPGTTSRDAPRKHIKRSRRSREHFDPSRPKSSQNLRSRVEKPRRYSSSDNESQHKRTKRKTWFGLGLAALAGKSLLDSGRRPSSRSSASSRESTQSYERIRRTHHDQMDMPGSFPSGSKKDTHRKMDKSKSSQKHAAMTGAALGSAASVLSSSHHLDKKHEKHKSAKISSRKSSSASDAYYGDKSNVSRDKKSGFSSLFSSTSPGEKVRSDRLKEISSRGASGSRLSFDNSGSAFGAETHPDLRKIRKSRSRKDDNIDEKLLGLSAAATGLAATAGYMHHKRRPEVLSKHRRSQSAPDAEWETEASSSYSQDSDLAYGRSSQWSLDSLDSQQKSPSWWPFSGSKKKTRGKRTASPGVSHVVYPDHHFTLNKENQGFQPMQNILPTPTPFPINSTQQHVPDHRFTQPRDNQGFQPKQNVLPTPTSQPFPTNPIQHPVPDPHFTHSRNNQDFEPKQTYFPAPISKPFPSDTMQQPVPDHHFSSSSNYQDFQPPQNIFPAPISMPFPIDTMQQPAPNHNFTHSRDNQGFEAMQNIHPTPTSGAFPTDTMQQPPVDTPQYGPNPHAAYISSVDPSQIFQPTPTVPINDGFFSRDQIPTGDVGITPTRYNEPQRANGKYAVSDIDFTREEPVRDWQENQTHGRSEARSDTSSRRRASSPASSIQREMGGQKEVQFNLTDSQQRKQHGKLVREEEERNRRVSMSDEEARRYSYEKQRKRHTPSQQSKAPTVIGSAVATAATAALIKKKLEDDERAEKASESRKPETETRARSKTVSNTRPVDISRTDERPRRPAKNPTQRARPSPVHKSYKEYFTPPELLSSSKRTPSKADLAKTAPDIPVFGSEDEATHTYRRRGYMDAPEPVPVLHLTQPTPPYSLAPSVASSSDDEPDRRQKQTSKSPKTRKDHIDFAATVAAATKISGFDPSIVTDNPTYYNSHSKKTPEVADAYRPSEPVQPRHNSVPTNPVVAVKQAAERRSSPPKKEERASQRHPDWHGEPISQRVNGRGRGETKPAQEIVTRGSIPGSKNENIAGSGFDDHEWRDIHRPSTPELNNVYKPQAQEPNNAYTHPVPDPNIPYAHPVPNPKFPHAHPVPDPNITYTHPVPDLNNVYMPPNPESNNVYAPPGRVETVNHRSAPQQFPQSQQNTPEEPLLSWFQDGFENWELQNTARPLKPKDSTAKSHKKSARRAGQPSEHVPVDQTRGLKQDSRSKSARDIPVPVIPELQTRRTEPISQPIPAPLEQYGPHAQAPTSGAENWTTRITHGQPEDWYPSSKQMATEVAGTMPQAVPTNISRASDKVQRKGPHYDDADSQSSDGNLPSADYHTASEAETVIEPISPAKSKVKQGSSTSKETHSLSEASREPQTYAKNVNEHATMEEFEHASAKHKHKDKHRVLPEDQNVGLPPLNYPGEYGMSTYDTTEYIPGEPERTLPDYKKKDKYGFHGEDERPSEYNPVVYPEEYVVKTEGVATHAASEEADRKSKKHKKKKHHAEDAQDDYGMNTEGVTTYAASEEADRKSKKHKKKKHHAPEDELDYGMKAESVSTYAASDPDRKSKKEKKKKHRTGDEDYRPSEGSRGYGMDTESVVGYGASDAEGKSKKHKKKKHHSTEEYNRDLEDPKDYDLKSVAEYGATEDTERKSKKHKKKKHDEDYREDATKSEKRGRDYLGFTEPDRERSRSRRHSHSRHSHSRAPSEHVRSRSKSRSKHDDDTASLRSRRSSTSKSKSSDKLGGFLGLFKSSSKDTTSRSRKSSTHTIGTTRDDLDAIRQEASKHRKSKHRHHDEGAIIDDDVSTVYEPSTKTSLDDEARRERKERKERKKHRKSSSRHGSGDEGVIVDDDASTIYEPSTRTSLDDEARRERKERKKHRKSSHRSDDESVLVDDDASTIYEPSTRTSLDDEARRERKERKKHRKHRYEDIVESGKQDIPRERRKSFLGHSPEMSSQDDGASGLDTLMPGYESSRSAGVPLATPPLDWNPAHRGRSRSVSPLPSEQVIYPPARSTSRSAFESVPSEHRTPLRDLDSKTFGTTSPTAIPLNLRLPGSPATISQGSPTRQKSGNPRPKSTEFKTNREFRPLWLVEQHATKTEPVDEPYPSLPSSKTTSRMSSTDDLSAMLRDYQYDADSASTGWHRPLLYVNTSKRDIDSDLLDSQQPTPTVATFKHQLKEGKEKPKYEFHSPSELNPHTPLDEAFHSPEEGVQPFSENVLQDSGSIQDRDNLDLEGLPILPLTPIEEDLPPLPDSPPESPLLVFRSEGRRQPSIHTSERSAQPIGVQPVEPLVNLPPLPASRPSSPYEYIHPVDEPLATSEADRARSSPSSVILHTEVPDENSREVLEIAESAVAAQGSDTPDISTSFDPTASQRESSVATSTSHDRAGPAIHADAIGPGKDISSQIGNAGPALLSPIHTSTSLAQPSQEKDEVPEPITYGSSKAKKTKKKKQKNRNFELTTPDFTQEVPVLDDQPVITSEDKENEPFEVDPKKGLLETIPVETLTETDNTKLDLVPQDIIETAFEPISKKKAKKGKGKKDRASKIESAEPAKPTVPEKKAIDPIQEPNEQQSEPFQAKREKGGKDLGKSNDPIGEVETKDLLDPSETASLSKSVILDKHSGGWDTYTVGESTDKNNLPRDLEARVPDDQITATKPTKFHDFLNEASLHGDPLGPPHAEKSHPSSEAAAVESRENPQDAEEAIFHEPKSGDDKKLVLEHGTREFEPVSETTSSPDEPDVNLTRDKTPVPSHRDPLPQDKDEVSEAELFFDTVQEQQNEVSRKVANFGAGDKDPPLDTEVKLESEATWTVGKKKKGKKGQKNRSTAVLEETAPRDISHTPDEQLDKPSSDTNKEHVAITPDPSEAISLEKSQQVGKAGPVEHLQDEEANAVEADLAANDVAPHVADANSPPVDRWTTPLPSKKQKKKVKRKQLSLANLSDDVPVPSATNENPDNGTKQSGAQNLSLLSKNLGDTLDRSEPDIQDASIDVNKMQLDTSTSSIVKDSMEIDQIPTNVALEDTLQLSTEESKTAENERINLAEEEREITNEKDAPTQPQHPKDEEHQVEHTTDKSQLPMEDSNTVKDEGVNLAEEALEITNEKMEDAPANPEHPKDEEHPVEFSTLPTKNKHGKKGKEGKKDVESVSWDTATSEATVTRPEQENLIEQSILPDLPSVSESTKGKRSKKEKKKFESLPWDDTASSKTPAFSENQQPAKEPVLQESPSVPIELKGKKGKRGKKNVEPLPWDDEPATETPTFSENQQPAEELAIQESPSIPVELKGKKNVEPLPWDDEPATETPTFSENQEPVEEPAHNESSSIPVGLTEGKKDVEPLALDDALTTETRASPENQQPVEEPAVQESSSLSLELNRGNKGKKGKKGVKPLPWDDNISTTEQVIAEEPSCRDSRAVPPESKQKKKGKRGKKGSEPMPWDDNEFSVAEQPEIPPENQKQAEAVPLDDPTLRPAESQESKEGEEITRAQDPFTIESTASMAADPIHHAPENQDRLDEPSTLDVSLPYVKTKQGKKGKKGKRDIEPLPWDDDIPLTEKLPEETEEGQREEISASQQTVDANDNEQMQQLSTKEKRKAKKDKKRKGSTALPDTPSINTGLDDEVRSSKAELDTLPESDVIDRETRTKTTELVDNLSPGHEPILANPDPEHTTKTDSVKSHGGTEDATRDVDGKEFQLSKNKKKGKNKKKVKDSDWTDEIPPMQVDQKPEILNEDDDEQQLELLSNILQKTTTPTQPPQDHSLQPYPNEISLITNEPATHAPGTVFPVGKLPSEDLMDSDTPIKPIEEIDHSDIAPAKQSSIQSSRFITGEEIVSPDLKNEPTDSKDIPSFNEFSIIIPQETAELERIANANTSTEKQVPAPHLEDKLTLVPETFPQNPDHQATGLTEALDPTSEPDTAQGMDQNQNVIDHQLDVQARDEDISQVKYSKSKGAQKYLEEPVSNTVEQVDETELLPTELEFEKPARRLTSKEKKAAKKKRGMKSLEEPILSPDVLASTVEEPPLEPEVENTGQPHVKKEEKAAKKEDLKVSQEKLVLNESTVLPEPEPVCLEKRTLEHHDSLDDNSNTSSMPIHSESAPEPTEAATASTPDTTNIQPSDKMEAVKAESSLELTPRPIPTEPSVDELAWNNSSSKNAKKKQKKKSKADPTISPEVEVEFKETERESRTTAPVAEQKASKKTKKKKAHTIWADNETGLNESQHDTSEQTPSKVVEKQEPYKNVAQKAQTEKDDDSWPIIDWEEPRQQLPETFGAHAHEKENETSSLDLLLSGDQAPADEVPEVGAILSESIADRIDDFDEDATPKRSPREPPAEMTFEPLPTGPLDVSAAHQSESQAKPSSNDKFEPTGADFTETPTREDRNIKDLGDKRKGGEVTGTIDTTPTKLMTIVLDTAPAVGLRDDDDGPLDKNKAKKGKKAKETKGSKHAIGASSGISSSLSETATSLPSSHILPAASESTDKTVSIPTEAVALEPTDDQPQFGNDEDQGSAWGTGKKSKKKKQKGKPQVKEITISEKPREAQTNQTAISDEVAGLSATAERKVDSSAAPTSNVPLENIKSVKSVLEPHASEADDQFTRDTSEISRERDNLDAIRQSASRLVSEDPFYTGPNPQNNLPTLFGSSPSFTNDAIERSRSPFRNSLPTDQTPNETLQFPGYPRNSSVNMSLPDNAPSSSFAAPASLFGGPFGLADRNIPISPPKTPLPTIKEHDVISYEQHDTSQHHPAAAIPDFSLDPHRGPSTAVAYGSSLLRARSFGDMQETHPTLRHVHSMNGDLKAAGATAQLGRRNFNPLPEQPLQVSSSSFSSPSQDLVSGKVKSEPQPRGMAADVFEGWGDVKKGPPHTFSPTRPPSVRRRRSLQHLQDLETRVEQLASENRQLESTKAAAEKAIETHAIAQRQHARALEARDQDLQNKESEIQQLKKSTDWLHKEIARLTETNESLTASNAELASSSRQLDDAEENTNFRAKWEQSEQELQNLQDQYAQVSAAMGTIVKEQVENAVAEKDIEIQRLSDSLAEAQEKIKELQAQLVASHRDDVLVVRDEDYFETACQKLCQHVQQWVLRFSKYSDMRICRLTSSLRDEQIVERFTNAILDGTDVNAYLSDRVKRRDVFMSVTMAIMWEFIFTRYLFGLDREQRQKLKMLEKHLSEVGPMSAVHKWRATTLTLLTKRPSFQDVRSLDSEAVVQEIHRTLSKLLPPPHELEHKVLDSLRGVMRAAVDLSIEMRTQQAEYIMLPPLRPEYDDNGELIRQVYFNAALMNERSGETTSNEELEDQQAVVRMVLFPLVVKKEGSEEDKDEEIVVCPAQVLVAKPSKDKRVVRVLSGDMMSLDPANRSVQSFHSIDPSNLI